MRILMPNISFLKKGNAEVGLTLCIANWLVSQQGNIEDVEPYIEKGINWERFNEIINYHELSPVAYLYFKQYPSLLPERESELLRKYYYSCLSHSFHLCYKFGQLSYAFKDRKVRCLPLKGIAFMIDNIYTNNLGYLRPMCDIDILVEEEKLLYAEQILEGLGYKKDLEGLKEDYWRRQNYHFVFINKEKKLSHRVELHWALDYPRDKTMLPNLWHRIKASQLEDKEMYLLSVEDTLFSLALHLRRFGKMFCLKNICDVAMILEKYKDNLDWDYFLKEADRGEMSTTVYFMLMQTSLLLDRQIPGMVLKYLRVPRYKRLLIERHILQNILMCEDEGDARHIKSLYLKSHLLLYNNFWEPINYIFKIPQEQFAKFYGLSAYAQKTELFYNLRCIYFLRDIIRAAMPLANKKK